MVKKLCYSIFCIVFGFVIFFFTWKDTENRAVINRSNKALETNDYWFFQKFTEYCSVDSLYDNKYTEDNNTTRMVIFEVFSEVAADEGESDGIDSRNGLMFVISNFNFDEVLIDEESIAEHKDEEDKLTEYSTVLYVYGDNGRSWTMPCSTYGCESCNVVLQSYSIDVFKSKLGGASSITKLKLVDTNNRVAYLDESCDINLIEHNDVSYWKNQVENGLAYEGFDDKEYRKYISFSTPEIYRTFIVTGIVILIMVGFGLFIFWPKKTYNLDTHDKERFTFAPEEEKEKSVLERVAKDKQERNDRENKYKNVRKSSDALTSEKKDEEPVVEENNTEEIVTENEENKEE